jgi:Uncharacterized conserved protein
MNAVEDNTFSQTWKKLGTTIARPSAVLSLSAHWFTSGTRIQTSARNRQVYDMYGFPKELYDVRYHPDGSPALAARVTTLISSGVAEDNSWGIDHGTWSVLCRMYPEADIPVLQLSIDRTATLQEQYDIGRHLQPLRDEGILILASGNIVHNLGMIDWQKPDGFAWADSFDAAVKNAVLAGSVQQVIETAGKNAAAPLAVPTPDHFMPLAYALGAAEGSVPAVFNDARTLGSMSMTGFIFG